MKKRLEIIDILRTLNKHKVQYAIAGGVAVGLFGFVRATKDLDLVLDFSKENIENFSKALKEIKLNPKVPINILDLADKEKRDIWQNEKNAVVLAFHNIDDLFFQIDVFLAKSLSDVKFEKRKTEDIEVNVVTLDELIKMKKEAFRPKDRIDLKQLEEISEQRKEL